MGTHTVTRMCLAMMHAQSLQTCHGNKAVTWSPASESLCRRSGNPLLSVDLARVSVETARSIIVLATADTPDRSDARVLRVVLSLMGVHDRLHGQGLPGLPVRGSSLQSLRLSQLGWSETASMHGRESLALPVALT